MTTDRLSILVKTTKIEKSPGTEGTTVPYIIDVFIDNRRALTLRREHFKETGQMHAFIEIFDK